MKPRKDKAKGHNLVDPALKKTFLEMRDHWKGLDDRANSASAKRRQYQNEIKVAGFSMGMVKDSLRLATPEGEAEFKAEIANRLLAAAYSDADIGEQLSLFLDHNRTPAVDRAYKEGQTCSMENKAAVPKYDPNTEQYRAYMEGFHDEQARAVKAGISKLEPKAKAKKVKVSPTGQVRGRGRPAKAAKQANGEAPAGSERRLIKKADKDAKAAARAPKADTAPPRKPVAVPATRASLAAEKAKTKDEAESYFTKSPTAGNA